MTSQARGPDGAVLLPPFRRFLLFALLAGFAALGLMFLRARGGSPLLFSGDGIGYYSYLPTLIIERDLDFSNQFTDRVLPEDVARANNMGYYYEHSKVTGRRANLFSVGPALIWSPWFVLAHGGALIAHQLNPSVGTDGYGLHYEIPVYLGSLLTTLLGVYWTYLLLLRLYRSPWVEWAVLGAALATPYVSFLVLFVNLSHGVAATVLAGYLLLCFRSLERPEDRRNWVWLGLLWGLLFLVRWQDVLYGSIGAAVLLANWRRGLALRTALAQAVSYGGFALLGALPQLLIWKVLFGSYVTVPQNQVDMERTSGYLNAMYLGQLPFGKMFFHPHYGLFTSTPLLLLSMIGLVLIARRYRAIAWTGLAMILMQVLIVGLTDDIGGGARFFGFRRLADAMPLFALGVGALLHEASSRGKSYGRVVTALYWMTVWWGAGGFLYYLATWGR